MVALVLMNLSILMVKSGGWFTALPEQHSSLLLEPPVELPLLQRAAETVQCCHNNGGVYRNSMNMANSGSSASELACMNT